MILKANAMLTTCRRSTRPKFVCLIMTEPLFFIVMFLRIRNKKSVFTQVSAVLNFTPAQDWSLTPSKGREIPVMLNYTLTLYLLVSLVS